MKKGVKTVLWVTGILVVFVVLMFALIKFFTNHEIIGCFLGGVIGVTFVIMIIAGIVRDIIGRVKLNKRKKSISQEKVTKKTPLPIYTGILYCSYIGYTIAFACLFALCFKNYYSGLFGVYATATFLVVALIIFGILFGQEKALYLYKDNAKVRNYDDELEESSLPLKLHMYIRSYNDYEYFILKKCERIQLYNDIEIWSCFSTGWSRSGSGDSKSSYDYSFIFSKVDFESEKNINILLCNDSSKYLHEDNIYIPKYSNLPPFVISGDVSESVCSNIEKICSDFFAKIRSKYVLTIQEGAIGLGLKSARFGGFKRIFNKDKTIKEIDEAVNEISDFLTQIKGIVEKY